jgi:dTDP-glucose 4,6-dehydratase/UDP-glucuronate decarboxylase
MEYAFQLKADAKAVLDVSDLSMLEEKTILITGASGLIGTHLMFSLEEFVQRGGVIKKCYALIFSELPVYLSEFLNYDWVEFLRGDITDNEFLNSLPNADFIIHAATYAQPIKFMENASKVIKINTLSTFALLDKLNINGKFLFISSSAVYTGCHDLPFNEEKIGCSNTDHPRSGYIEGKRCGEAIVNAYRNKGVDAKCIRLQFTYGPGVRIDDARVLSQFVKHAFTDRCINLLDDGRAERVYIYITDTIELIWKILLFGKSNIYNVAGSSNTSIFQLAESIGTILSVPVNKRDASNAVAGANLVEKLDMSKTEKEFNKINYIPLDDGLRRTISWMQENYHD